MSDQRIKIPRALDRSLAKTFRSLAEQYGQSVVHVRVLGFSDLGQVNIVEEPEGDWKVLLDHDSTIILSMGMSVGGLSINYSRGGEYIEEKKSPIFDEIVLRWNNQQSPSISERINIVSFINTNLNSFAGNMFSGCVVTDEQSALASIHHSTLDRLESLNEYLIRQSSDFRQGLEEKFDIKLQKIEKDYAEKKVQIEIEAKSVEEKLADRERSIEERLKIIDDRDNTHVRREIRDKMLDDVKRRVEQFGVSKGTQDKRKPVLNGIIGLLVVMAFLLIWTAYEITMIDDKYSGLETASALSLINSGNSSTFFENSAISGMQISKFNGSYFWVLARFVLYSVGFVGTILFYIKWQNRWAEQHMISELQLQQFYIDVNRANWVIESCLEWHKSTSSEISKELLESITRNLFMNNSNEPERVIHPADELASALIGSASKLRLKVGDSEIDFNKPSKLPKKPIKCGVSGPES